MVIPSAPHYGRGALAASFVVGAVLGMLFGWSWNTPATKVTDEKKDTSPAASETRTNSALSTSGTPANTSGMIVSDQDAGLSVQVSGVVVEKPTWVVVRESRNGEAGNVLGAKLFFPASQGGASSGKITLLRATVSGQKYLIETRIDDGDKKFSIQGDILMSVGTGSFMAQ